jgi:hypothetical protein
MVSINVLCIVIVGGMGSIPGIVLGSIALKGLPEMLRELDIYRLMVFGALLVVMMIIRPEGLMPAKSVKLEQQFETGNLRNNEPRYQGPSENLPGQVESGNHDVQKAPESSGGDHDRLS